MPRSPGAAALQQAAEAVLVTLATHGDRDAFGELVRRRQSWLRSLLRRLCRDAALADDLAQQCLLQAWRKLATLRAPHAFGGWLRRLALTTWLQHVRRTEDLEPLEAALGDSADTPVPPGVHQQLDLDAALARLGAAERVCVVLNYHEGLSHAEISAATGWPLGTVKSHIQRGAARLRVWLADYEEQAR